MIKKLFMVEIWSFPQQRDPWDSTTSMKEGLKQHKSKDLTPCTLQFIMWIVRRNLQSSKRKRNSLIRSLRPLLDTSWTTMRPT